MTAERRTISTFEPGAAILWNRSGAASLGWMGCLLGMINNCCFAPPPELRTNEQVPPFVIDSQVDPPLSSVLRVQDQDSIVLTVPFRSEDAGEPLRAVLYFDFAAQGSEAADGPERPTPLDVPAANFDRVRELVVEWSVLGSPGCHSLTLILTHSGNLEGSPPLPIDDTAAAYVSWFVALSEAGQPAVNLLPCP